MPLSARGRKMGIVGGSFEFALEPDYIPDLVAWFDASYSGCLWQDIGKITPAVNDGDLVKIWTDRVSSRDASNTNDSWKPAIDINAGRKGVLFQYDFLRTTSNVTTGDPHTIIVVAESLSRNNGNYEGICYVGGIGATGQNSCIGYNSGNYWFGGFNQTANSGDAVNTSIHILAKTYDEAGSIVKGYLDDVEIASHSLTYTYTSDRMVGIGAHYNNPTSPCVSNTRIYELLVYNRKLDLTELTAIYNYLVNKWGL